MDNIGLTQLLLITLIALSIFGATRLPEISRVLGHIVDRKQRGRRAGSAQDQPALADRSSCSTESRQGLAA